MKNKDKYDLRTLERRVVDGGKKVTFILDGEEVMTAPAYGCFPEFFKWLEKGEHELTEDEKDILRYVDSKYKWIARDDNGALYLYTTKPVRENYVWRGLDECRGFTVFNDRFKSVQWDTGAMDIEEWTNA